MPRYSKEQRKLYTVLYKKLRLMLKYDASIGKMFESELTSALEQGFLIDFTPSKRYSPLLYEAIYRSDSAAMYMLDAGSDVNILDNYRNALILTIELGSSAEVVEKVLKRTIKVDQRDDCGYTALLRLCRNMVLYKFRSRPNDFTILNLLLKAGASTEGLDDFCSDFLDRDPTSINGLRDKEKIDRKEKLVSYVKRFLQHQEELMSEKKSTECLPPVSSNGYAPSFYEYEL